MEHLYTPKEAAIRLKLFKEGVPNVTFLRGLCRKGELEYVEISQRNIRITESAIADFIKRKTCREEIKENTSRSERIAGGGASSNTQEETNIGLKAAMAAEMKLTEHLRSLASANVVQISRSVR